MAQQNGQKSGLILNRYRIISLIKQTKRKQIFLLENVNSGEKCIMKSQQSDQEAIKNGARTVLHQANFLHSMQGHLGFPFMIWSGQQDKKQILLIQQLGTPIFQLFKEFNNKFSLKTVCMIGLQFIGIIQDYHSMGFVHRRLLPKSIQLGKRSKNHVIHINDFFDSKKYTNQKTNRHLEPKKNSKLSSHLSPFTTVNQIQSGQSSRRDDIEAIILILIYFLKGSLPWQHITSENIEDSQEKMYLLKKQIQIVSVQKLCQNLPIQFSLMLKRIRKLEFMQQPSYQWYVQQLQRIMHRFNYENDYIYDWVISQSQSMKRLKVQKILPSINLPQELLILEKYYYPYEENVDVDEIAQKFRQLKIKSEQEDFSAADSQSKKQQKNQKNTKPQKKKVQCQMM